MLSANDVARVYDTILSIPGMSEVVKMDFKISRKNVLLLSSVIERGLSVKEEDSGLLDNVPSETVSELRAIATDILMKAGLTELSEKLVGLGKE